MGELDIGPLQVLLLQGAHGLLIFLPGDFWPVPRKKESRGRGSNEG
jgi:hypothetical protein